MLKIKYGTIQESRDEVIRYVKDQKDRDSDYAVIDIGGSVNGWSHEIVDAIADINANGLLDYKMNVSVEEDWKPLEEAVRNRGRFNFAICTHTIEDISNPALLLRKLPKIAMAGIITAPSVRTEMSHVEDPRWLGYIHHRHMIGVQDMGLVLAPKLGFINVFQKETLTQKDITFDPSQEEIAIWWEGNKINFSMIMEDYLGPNIESVLESYYRFIKDNV